MEQRSEKKTSSLCRRFGTIAVKKSFITESQLKEALIKQIEEDLEEKGHRLIGAIISEKGWMTWEEVDAVLKELFEE